MTRLYQPIGILAAGSVLLLILGHDLASVDYHAMVRILFHTRPSILVLAGAGTLMSFLALVARDAFAIGYIRERVPLSASVLSGFCANAVGQSVGFGPLTKATIRYRIYRGFGVPAEKIARLLLFISGGFALGLVGVAAVAGLVEAPSVGELANLPPDWVRAISLAIPVSFVLTSDFFRRGELIASLLAVLAIELLNTSVEKLCDHTTPRIDPAIKIVKDLGSAAVFCALLMAGAVWLGAALARFA